jgi:exopolysaccharide production protein ExoY
VIPSSSQNPSREKRGPIQIPRWKRILDLLFIGLTLPLVLPVAILIGTLIALVSPGPVLFRQERVGFRGNRFMCLKFRTMFVRAETACHQNHLDDLINSDAPMVKLDAHGDSRIIPFGSLLRSSGLDELPQLINVFRGDMSVVGPRPCMAYEYDRYLPWQTERFDTLPGLTGLWQVSGKNRTTFNEMIGLDIKYAREKTLRLDLLIILKTLPVMFGQVWESWRRRKSSVNQKNLPSRWTFQTDNLAANGIEMGNLQGDRENLGRKRDGIKS